MEEMSHLALACNLLLSTNGGEPRLAYKDVVKHSWKSMLRLVTFSKLQIDHIELQISIQI